MRMVDYFLNKAKIREVTSIKTNRHWQALEKDIPAKKHDNCIALGRNETQQKNIFASTVVTLQSGLTERRKCMQHNLLVLCTN